VLCDKGPVWLLPACACATDVASDLDVTLMYLHYFTTCRQHERALREGKREVRIYVDRGSSVYSVQCTVYSVAVAGRCIIHII